MHSNNVDEKIGVYNVCDAEQTELLYGDNSIMNWKDVQMKDEDIRFILENFVDNEDISKNDINNKSSFVKHFFNKRQDLLVENGLLFLASNKDQGLLNRQLIVNDSCISVLIDYYHNRQGHLGEDRTLNILKARFYWPKMSNLIKHKISTCDVCVARKSLPKNNRTELYHRPVAKHPLDILALDHLVVESLTAKHKILTIVCEFSKFLFIIPVKGESAKITADQIIKNIFMKYGIPNTIHTDNARSFCNKTIEELTGRTGIVHTKSVPYHSMGNPVVERCQQVILNMLGTLSSSEKLKWFNHCEYISYAYNTTVHTTTGLSPYFLMFGRHPKLIGDAILGISYKQPTVMSTDKLIAGLKKAYKICRNSIKDKHDVFKKIYDHKLSRFIDDLIINDVVLVKNQHLKTKIDNRWSDDSYIIINIPDVSMPVYEIKNVKSGKTMTRHRNQLLLLYRQDGKCKVTMAEQDEPVLSSVNVTDSNNISVDDSNLCTSSSDSDITDDLIPDQVSNVSEDSVTSNSNSTENEADGLYRTRSGRVVRPPDKLSLCVQSGDYKVV